MLYKCYRCGRVVHEKDIVVVQENRLGGLGPDVLWNKNICKKCVGE